MGLGYSKVVVKRSHGRDAAAFAREKRKILLPLQCSTGRHRQPRTGKVVVHEMLVFLLFVIEFLSTNILTGGVISKLSDSS